MKNKLILLFITIIPFIGNSQNDTSKTGTTVIFYGSSTTDRGPIVYNSNALKFGLFDIVSGLYGLHYEKELSSIFSFQAGGGLTGKNFAQTLINSEAENDKHLKTNFIEPDVDLFDNHYDFSSRTAKMGYFLTLHPKFYFEEAGFDGQYLGFILSYRRYNFDAQDVNTSLESSSSATPTFNQSKLINEFENNLIIAASYGHQNIGEKTASDWNIAVGLKKITGERRDIGYIRQLNPDPFGNEYSYMPTTRLLDVSRSAFYFEFSYKIGLHWSKAAAKM